MDSKYGICTARVDEHRLEERGDSTVHVESTSDLGARTRLAESSHDARDIFAAGDAAAHVGHRIHGHDQHVRQIRRYPDRRPWLVELSPPETARQTHQRWRIIQPHERW